jgi:hypothetical protein
MEKNYKTSKYNLKNYNLNIIGGFTDKLINIVSNVFCINNVLSNFLAFFNFFLNAIPAVQMWVR